MCFSCNLPYDLGPMRWEGCTACLTQLNARADSRIPLKRFVQVVSFWRRSSTRRSIQSIIGMGDLHFFFFSFSKPNRVLERSSYFSPCIYSIGSIRDQLHVGLLHYKEHSSSTSQTPRLSAMLMNAKHDNVQTLNTYFLSGQSIPSKLPSSLAPEARGFEWPIGPAYVTR